MESTMARRFLACANEMFRRSCGRGAPVATDAGARDGLGELFCAPPPCFSTVNKLSQRWLRHVTTIVKQHPLDFLSNGTRV